MNELNLVLTIPSSVLAFGGELRMVGNADAPAVVAADLLKALYPQADPRNYRNYLKKVPDKWKGHKRIMTPGGVQDVVTLLEAGVYFVINRSDSEHAVPVQEWVCADVLPSIRKYGCYPPPATQPVVKTVMAGLEVETFLVQVAQGLLDQKRMILAHAAEIKSVVQRQDESDLAANHGLDVLQLARYEQMLLVQDVAEIKGALEVSQEERRRALAEIRALPPATVEAPQKTTRTNTGKLVSNWAKTLGGQEGDYRRTWNALYDEYGERTRHFVQRVYQNALKNGVKLDRLDLIANHGLSPNEKDQAKIARVQEQNMQILYAIAREMYGSRD